MTDRLYMEDNGEKSSYVQFTGEETITLCVRGELIDLNLSEAVEVALWLLNRLSYSIKHYLLYKGEV